MIEKYYSGVIEQIYNRIGKETRNIVMANYSNDFSIENLEVIRRYQSLSVSTSSEPDGDMA